MVEEGGKDCGRERASSSARLEKQAHRRWWSQECCPLIVMEAVLRGIPCVSSDWGGLPEANPHPELRVRATLAYDHARGVVHHGMSNYELEEVLGRSLLPDDRAPDPSARQQVSGQWQRGGGKSGAWPPRLDVCSCV